MDRKPTPDSPATARAKRVLPVPGGPTKSTPLGTFAPIWLNRSKKIAPAIVFIDEIDAVGRRRGAGLGGGHDEREQTLNQLLVEMDGFQKNEGVIVLAATNRQDILDPALMRPGRFDRQIYVGTPDVQGRQDILKIYARDKRLDEQVDLKAIALATAGFTGADLENPLW